ncbi:hypothetical protein [Paraburkholderia fungorum]|uniref:hypothetical protein n=1 Tax=Paraburkholderia fungorum TaxID=134537 RepID=UPI004063C783
MRAYLWRVLAALTCPCHLPVLLVALSGTAAGALVSRHMGVVALVLIPPVCVLSHEGATRVSGGLIKRTAHVAARRPLAWCQAMR